MRNRRREGKEDEEKRRAMKKRRLQGEKIEENRGIDGQERKRMKRKEEK